MPDLKSIQDTYLQLWTSREARQTALSAGGDLDERGVRLYASLIEIGRLDLMRSIYPCIEALLGKKFKDLVLSYYECMPADHYNLNKSARRFSQYLQEHEPKLLERHPFIVELADFEWVELEVMEAAVDAQSAQISEPDLDDALAFASARPILADVVYLRRYHYPVMAISKKLLDGEKLPRRVKKEETFIAIYRDMHNHECRFLELGELSFEVLAKLKENPETNYGELIKYAVQQCSDGAEETVQEFLNLINELKEAELIIGDT